jgi:hypothetical protein
LNARLVQDFKLDPIGRRPTKGQSAHGFPACLENIRGEISGRIRSPSPKETGFLDGPEFSLRDIAHIGSPKCRSHHHPIHTVEDPAAEPTDDRIPPQFNRIA